MWIKCLSCKHENLSIISMKMQNMLAHTCNPSVEEADQSKSLIAELNQVRDFVPKSKLEIPEEY